MGRLLMLTLAVYCCTAAPSTDLVVPENLDFTTFSKLAPTDFLQAVIKSGGTKADCRSFATNTISTIGESVKSQEETWAAVDTGAGCASEGQEFVRVAQANLQGKQGVLASKQGSAKAAREAKTAACTAAVDISVGLDTLTKTSCYDYATEASFMSADAACNQAKTAVTQADGAVDAAQTGVEDAQGEVDDAVAEAARLESGCLCRVHQEQADAQSAVQKATASNAADWKQAQEVLCALDQTTPTQCSVPACPTVTQPTLAAGVANADKEHCTAAPTESPTESPTTPTCNRQEPVGFTDTAGWTVDGNPVTTCGWMAHICKAMSECKCYEQGGDTKCQWVYLQAGHGLPAANCGICRGFKIPDTYGRASQWHTDAWNYYHSDAATQVWTGNWICPAGTGNCGWDAPHSAP